MYMLVSEFRLCDYVGSFLLYNVVCMLVYVCACMRARVHVCMSGLQYTCRFMYMTCTVLYMYMNAH